MPGPAARPAAGLLVQCLSIKLPATCGLDLRKGIPDFGQQVRDKKHHRIWLLAKIQDEVTR
jgi:hypothetical protein